MTMPRRPEGEKRPADVIGNAVRKKFIGVSIALATTVGWYPSALAFGNSETLQSACKSPHDSAQWGYCVGYIVAIADQMTVIGFQRVPFGDGSKPRPNEAICPDKDNADATVIVPLFVNWAEHHPDRAQFPAFENVSTALQQKWPCHFSN
jgi:hypothetical protein